MPTTRPRCARRWPRPVAAPRPAWKRSSARAPAAAFAAAVEGLAGEDARVIPLALSRGDVADYVSALFTVYIILILLNVLISYVPRMPYRPWLRSVLDFITDTHQPLPRLLPPLPAAGRRQRLRPRPQPDRRDHRPVRAADRRRRPDRRVSASARAWCPGRRPGGGRPRRRPGRQGGDRGAPGDRRAGRRARPARPHPRPQPRRRLRPRRWRRGAADPRSPWWRWAWSATSSPATRPGRGCGSRPGCWRAARSATSPTASAPAR